MRYRSVLQIGSTPQLDMMGALVIVSRSERDRDLKKAVIVGSEKNRGGRRDRARDVILDTIVIVSGSERGSCPEKNRDRGVGEKP